MSVWLSVCVAVCLYVCLFRGLLFSSCFYPCQARPHDVVLCRNDVFAVPPEARKSITISKTRSTYRAHCRRLPCIFIAINCCERFRKSRKQFLFQEVFCASARPPPRQTSSDRSHQCVCRLELLYFSIGINCSARFLKPRNQFLFQQVGLWKRAAVRATDLKQPL